MRFWWVARWIIFDRLAGGWNPLVRKHKGSEQKPLLLLLFFFFFFFIAVVVVVVEREREEENMAVDREAQFHVLAVDDSLIDRKLIERLLKTSSYQGTLTAYTYLHEWGTADSAPTRLKCF